MEPKKPIYLRMSQELQEKIEQGIYKPGDQLPTESELTETFSVSRVTARKSLDTLVQANLIERIPGRGTFVLDTAEEERLKNQFAKDNEKVIGVILPATSPCFGTQLIYEISRALQKENMHLIYTGTEDNQFLEAKAIHDSMQLPLDGLLIWPAPGEFISNEIIKLVIADFPVILLDRYIQDTKSNSVTTDNPLATKLALDHLLELNHKKIAIASRKSSHDTSIRDRLLTAQFHLTNQDQTINCYSGTLLIPKVDYRNPTEVAIHVTEFKPQLEKFLKENPTTSAFFVTEYYPATFLYVCLTELGYNVPNDFSIVCFDSPLLYLEPTLRFTHIKQNEAELAQKSVDLLKEVLAEPDSKTNFLVEPDLVIGDTTTPFKEK
ncbi:GntR family transcriptional regulator [Carnobacterium gallinarum]|uniref:GntR family transcriptional regulator n=1 Tax=Carnobacterium gallinarum TaxID=2749 RepID=UPI00054DEA74|nr:GntR family transcriptional regulator [Carnobacterium gallinarum]